MQATVFTMLGVKTTTLPRDPQRKHFDYRDVHANAQGLSLDGKLVVASAHIGSVSLILGERTSVAVGTTGSPGFAFTFTKRADADALVRALDRDPNLVAAEVDVEPSLMGVSFGEAEWWQALTTIFVSVITVGVLLPFLLRPNAAAPRLARVLSMAQTLTLGTDGLRMRRVRTEAFLPYSEIAAVHAMQDAVHLVLRDGRTHVIKLSVAECVREVVERIERARGRVSSLDGDGIAERLRSASGASLVTSLREMTAESSSAYREASVPRERLWRVVEDPDESAEIRARAAIALSGSLEQAERLRLRVAADATAAPKLRVALFAAETAQDAALAEHLEAVEREHHGHRRRSS